MGSSCTQEVEILLFHKLEYLKLVYLCQLISNGISTLDITI